MGWLRIGGLCNSAGAALLRALAMTAALGGCAAPSGGAPERELDKGGAGSYTLTWGRPLTRQPGDRVERLAHGVIAERTGTAHESRDLAIELGELRKTVNAVAEITEESHVSMIAFIDVYHKTL